MVGAGLMGGVLGFVLPMYQHRLYSEAAYRAEPAAGRKLRALQAFAAVSAGASLAAAARPGYYDLGPRLLTAAFLVVLVTLSSTDFDRRRIPNVVTYPAVVAALALSWAWPDRAVADIAIGTGAAVCVAVVLGFLRFGGGDLKLVVLMGALLGWPDLMPALLYGVLAGGLVAAALLVLRGRGSTFAYGPYLAAGAAVVMLFPRLT